MRKRLLAHGLEAKFSVMMRLCHADPRLRYVRNTTANFPEDDNLFIQLLFPHFHLNLGYDSARSVVKREVCSEMHSSQGSGCLPGVHPQYMASEADPQDQPAEPTLQPSSSVPIPGQHELRGGFDTNKLAAVSRQEGDSGLRRLL
jgi:hypothetical protein